MFEQRRAPTEATQRLTEVVVEIPASLPSRMYLLAYEPTRQRVVGGGQLDLVVRAAALTQLFLDGDVNDVDGKPRATGARSGGALLEDLRQEIAQSKPRSWNRWASSGGRRLVGAVQEDLAAAGLIRIEPRRVLGIFPAKRIIVPDTRPVLELRERVARALREETPVARVERGDAALVALAAVGGLRTAIPRAEVRAHRTRIAQLVGVAGPAVPALRRAIQQRQAAAATGGG